MKLLHEVVRLCAAGMRGASGRGITAPREFRVTVPAPLAKSGAAGVAGIAAPRTATIHAPTPRPEPTAFPQAPRHLRQVSRR